MSKRVDRIKALIPMEEFLRDYGYISDIRNRPQQFRCDLHGDTKDYAPSARVYPADNHTYCFACGKSRDVISWTMEKEGLAFSEACRFLERRFGLPEWRFQEPEAERQPEITPDFNRVESLVKSLGDVVPLEKITVVYETIDCLRFQYERGRAGSEIQESLDKTREKLISLCGA